MDTTADLQEQIKQAPLPLIAARIRRARRDFGSHDKLASATGTSRQHLIKLEKGSHRPRAEMLTRIAEATGRSVDWFVDPEVDPSPFPDGQDGDAGRADRGVAGAPDASVIGEAA